MDSDTILNSCDQWRATVIQPDGSGIHNDESRQLTLLRNGCVYQDLDIDGIQAVCVGLTDRLHYRNSGQYIDEDQRQFWKWSAKFFGTEEAKNIIGDNIYSHLKDLIFPTLFCNENPFLRAPSHPDPRFNQFVKSLVRSHAQILSYLTFPLLEAVGRSNCSAYIDPDGLILNDLRIDGRAYKSGKRCSSLKHVLMLAEELSSNSFKHWHTRLKPVIQRITPSASLYEAIYGWRNEVLHGNDFVRYKNRVVLNIALLFLLEKCRTNYDAVANSASDIE